MNAREKEREMVKEGKTQRQVTSQTQHSLIDNNSTEQERRKEREREREKQETDPSFPQHSVNRLPLNTTTTQYIQLYFTWPKAFTFCEPKYFESL